MCRSHCAWQPISLIKHVSPFACLRAALTHAAPIHPATLYAAQACCQLFLITSPRAARPHQGVHAAGACPPAASRAGRSRGSQPALGGGGRPQMPVDCATASCPACCEGWSATLPLAQRCVQPHAMLRAGRWRAPYLPHACPRYLGGFSKKLTTQTCTPTSTLLHEKLTTCSWHQDTPTAVMCRRGFARAANPQAVPVGGSRGSLERALLRCSPRRGRRS